MKIFHVFDNNENGNWEKISWRYIIAGNEILKNGREKEIKIEIYDSDGKLVLTSDELEFGENLPGGHEIWRFENSNIQIYYKRLNMCAAPWGRSSD